MSEEVEQLEKSWGSHHRLSGRPWLRESTQAPVMLRGEVNTHQCYT